MVACLGNREEQIQRLTEQNCRHVDRTSDVLVIAVTVLVQKVNFQVYSKTVAIAEEPIGCSSLIYLLA